MRTRFFFLAASVTSIAAAAVAQGCGETETETTPGDAGADVAADTRREAAPPVEEDAEPPCDTTKDFTLDIPDADIADGASTTGICVACTNQHCKKEVDSCNQNCECQGIAADALECYAQNSGDILKCIGKFPTNVSNQTKTTGVALFGCMNENCKDECQTEAFTSDGGTDAASDAANDGS